MMKRVSVFGLVLLLCAGTATYADTLYGITWGDQLISINTATGAGTLIGNLSSSMGAFGLGNIGSSLYAFDQMADRLVQLDPTTAATIASIDLGLSVVGEGGLTFGSDGAGFLTESSGSVGTMYGFSLSPGSGYTIGSLASSVDGLDFLGGTLYALDQYGYSLYTVNPATAAMTLVGSTGVSPGGTNVAGLAATSDGTLYAAMNQALYLVNSTTGSATLIGGIGFGDISGLTAIDTGGPVIPAPGAILLGTLGTGLVGWLRRRKAL